jgi:hypothetical protein
LPDLFANVALLECADKATLDEVLGTGLERYVVRRLSETVVVVDHARVEELLKLLRRQGQTPKVTRE